MKTFILTIPSRPEMAYAAHRRLVSGEYDHEVFKGVDCRSDPHWFDKVQVAEIGLRALRNAEICCAQGHINIMKEIVARGLPYAMVMEDDGVPAITGYEMEQLAADLNTDQPEWDFAMVSKSNVSSKKAWPNDDDHYRETHRFIRVKETELGTHGYLISAKGCKYFIREGQPIFTPIDCMFRYRAAQLMAFHSKLPHVFIDTGATSSIDRTEPIPDRTKELEALNEKEACA